MKIVFKLCIFISMIFSISQLEARIYKSFFPHKARLTDLTLPKILKNWKIQSIDKIEEGISVRQVARYLVEMRNNIIHQGHNPPLVSNLCKQLAKSLSNDGCAPPRLFFQALMREIRTYERSFAGKNFALSRAVCNSQLTETKKENEVKVSGKTALGFCLVLAGSLVCVIPGAQGVGGAVIAAGGTMIIDGLNDPPSDWTTEDTIREMDAKRREYREKNLRKSQ